MTTDEFAVPDLDLPGPAQIRRAVLRGILSSGFAAAAWLAVAAILGFFAILGVNAVRTGHFHDVAFYGARVGHPEFVAHGGACCSANLGLTNWMALDATVRGTHPAPVTGSVRQGLFGGISGDLPPSEGTPIGDALSRDRPAKDGTRTFVDSLPPSVSVSAVVEFAQPLTIEDYLDFPHATTEAVLLADPYGGNKPISWPSMDLRSFTKWAGGLDPDDDETLDNLGSPPVSELRAAARDPRVHAFVIDSATVGAVRELLADPRVRSVNIADVGFDPMHQFPGN
jgi:hypothetical protein